MTDKRATTTTRRWKLSIPIIIVLVAVAYLVLRKNEPEYGDRSLSYWLAQLGPEPPSDPPLQAAQVAVRAIGTNALPYLLERFTAEDSLIKRKLIDFDKDHDEVSLNLEPASSKAAAAMAGYMVLGEIAEPSAKELAAIVQGSRPGQVWYSVQALPYLGQGGIRHLLEIVAKTNVTPFVRRFGVAALAHPTLIAKKDPARFTGFSARYRVQASIATPLLIDLLADWDTDVAYFAASTLGQLSLQPELVIPALTNLAVKESVPTKVRRGAIRAVGRFGEKAIATTGFLRTLTNDPTSSLYGAATNALVQIHERTSDRQTNIE